MKRLRKGVLLTLLMLCVAIGGMMAGCGKKKVTISFDTMGGNQTYESVQVVAGEDFILQIPTREGYEFAGWYDNQSLTGTALMGGSAKAPDTDTTYYASWSQLMKATLDANGGVFADGTETKEVFIAKGKKLLEALSEYTPTHGSLQLGAWCNAAGPIGEDDVMPSREITLTAKYSVSYSVEVYTQSTSDQYDRDPSHDFNGMGFLDDDTTVEAPEIEGFEFFRNHPEGIPTLKLQEDTSKNKFKLYYNKHAYTVIYNVNAPANTTFSGFMADQRVLYGEEGFAMECGYSIRSYRFAGWSRSASGDVEVKPGEKLPEGSYTLYAIWDAGYSDVFGGTDFIYFPHEGKDGSAILQRGNAEIPGRTCNRDADGNYTEDVNGMFVKFSDNLIAKLVDSNPKTFSFFATELAGEYVFYDPHYGVENPIDEGVKLTLDGFDGAVLVDATGSSDYRVSLDEESGYYRLTKGNISFQIILGVRENKKVFTELGGEAGSYQEFNRISIVNYAPGNNTLYLDGLGNASWGLSSSSALRGKYSIVEENKNELIKVHFDNDTESSFIFLNFGTLIAVSKEDGLAGDYTLDDGNKKLTLDGFEGLIGGAYFEENGSKREITYMVESNIYGKTVSVIENNKVTAKYTLNEKEHKISVPEELVSIHKYLYSDQAGNNLISDEIYLVITEAKEGEAQKARIVKSVNGGEPQVIVEGTIAPDEKNKPLTKFTPNEGTESKSDDFPYSQFSFYVSDRFVVGSLFYVYLDREIYKTYEKSNFTHLHPRNGGDQDVLIYRGLNTAAAYGLSGIGSFLIDENGTITEGSFDMLFPETALTTVEKYFEGDNFYSFSFYNASGAIQKKYFAIYQNGEDPLEATYDFEEVRDEPRALAEAYDEMPNDGSNYPFAQEYSLFFDGRGSALILMETDAGSQYIKGNYSSLGLVNNLQSYSITLTEGEFNGQEIQIVISGLNSNYFYTYNGFMEGHNDIDNGGYVELDGWGTHAKYVDNFGHEYEGYYCFYPNKSGIIIYPDMQTGIAQVNIVDGKFVNTPTELQGGTGGSLWRILDQNMEEYLGMENAAANFDGEGGVTVENLQSYMDWQINGGDSNSWGYKREIYGRGFYTQLSEFEFELEVGFYGADGSVTRREKWRAKLSGGNCIKLESASVGSYIQDSDKSVLYLNGYGEGFYVDARGNREDGNYQYVDKDNNVMLFLNENVNYLFKTDSNRSFKSLNDPTKFRTFYADDMTSLEFESTLKVDGQQIGIWYFDDSNNFVYYEFTGTGFARSTAYQYPQGDTYEAEIEKGKKVTFHAWNGGVESDRKELTGKIEFRALKEAGKDKSTIEGVKLSFTPDGTVGINADAVLTYTDTIKNDGVKTYENIYTVKKVPMTAYLGIAGYLTYELFLCYGDMQFPLNVNGNEFTVWANIDPDRNGIDLLQFLGTTTEPYAKVDLGSAYTLGVRTWTLSELGVEDEDLTLLGGYACAEDKNGDLVCFETLWHKDRSKEEGRIIGTTTEENITIDIPVYEIFTKSMDGKDDLVVLLELMPAEAVGENYYYALYAACNYVEVEVSLPQAGGGKLKTDDYKVFEERSIGTSKGFAENGVAYYHVYKKNENAENTRHPGYEDISMGFSMFLQSSDYMLVEEVNNNQVGKASRVFVISPEFVKKDTWDQGKVTLWFGINKHVDGKDTSMKDDKDFKDFSYDIILLTNQYRDKDDKSEDTRQVLDGWLTFLYYTDPKTDEQFGSTFQFGYGEDGKTRISRIKSLDGKRQFNLKFGGTVKDTEVKFESYTPPKEEDDQGSGDEG